MDWFVALLIIAPAGLLFANRSSWLLDYLIWITVLNRGIRRYVDWLNGSFNILSPISLTPLIISGLMFLLVLQHYPKFPAYFQRIFQLFSAALVLGFTVGIVRNQFAAVYALAEYLSPLAIMGYAVMADGNERVLDRWIKCTGWAALAVSLYGWYQYYTIPPWDAFWVRAVGFEGYLGQLRPTEMTVFSTMSERATLAGFLALAVIPMILSSRWRNVTSWLGVAFILSTMLLTFVRTSLITVALATLFFPILNRGKNTVQIVLLIGALGLGAVFGLRFMPSSDKISARLETLQSIGSDGSFQGRVDILQYGLGASLSNPLGTGLGSTGLGGRVNSGGIDTGGVIGDNGYLEILFTFGWIGFGCIFYIFFLIWQQLRRFEKQGIRSESSMMFKALFVTGAITLMSGNWLASTGAVIFYIFAGFSLAPKAARKRRSPSRSAKPRHPLAELPDSPLPHTPHSP